MIHKFVSALMEINARSEPAGQSDHWQRSMFKLKMLLLPQSPCQCLLIMANAMAQIIAASFATVSRHAVAVAQLL